MYHFLLKLTILQILVYARRPERINLKIESLAYGLRLCPADVNKNTFLKDRSNEIIAIDFSCYSLLPLPFVELAFRLGDDFARSVRAHIKLPETKQLDSLIAAQESLVSFGCNVIGEHSCHTVLYGTLTNLLF